jgi:hypothetical protein
MIKLKDILEDGSDYRISLKKMFGTEISDIIVSLSTETGEVTVELLDVKLANGLSLGCEGEHDFPYLVSFMDAPVNFDEETLESLYRELYP